MSKQDLDERREELIRDERVRQMIRVRAYEIYQMRGPQPGGQAQDWFQAENEVLSFLIADESRQIENEPSTASAPVAASPAKATVTKKSSSRIASAARTTSKKRITKKSPDTKPKPARKRSTPKEPK